MTTTTITTAVIFAAALVSIIAMVLVPVWLAIRCEFLRASSGHSRDKVTGWINRITGLAGSIAVVAVICLVLTQFSVVLLRYFFSVGSIELQEAVVYFHAIIFMFGVGVTLKNNEHVRLDVIYAKLKPRARAIVNLTGTILLLIPFAMTVAVTGFNYVSRSWATRESSIEASGLNYVYLLKTVILIFVFLMLAQAICWVIDAIRILHKPAASGGSEQAPSATARRHR